MNKSAINLANAERVMNKITNKKVKSIQKRQLLINSKIPKNTLTLLAKNGSYYFNFTKIINKYTNDLKRYRDLKVVKDKNGINLKEIEYLVHHHLATVTSSWLKRDKAIHQKYLKLNLTDKFERLSCGLLRAKAKKYKTHAIILRRHLKVRKYNKAKDIAKSRKTSFKYLKKSYDIAYKHWYTSKKLKKRYALLHKPKKITKNPHTQDDRHAGIQILEDFANYDECEICLEDSEHLLKDTNPWNMWHIFKNSPTYKYLNFDWLFRLTICGLIYVNKPFKNAQTNNKWNVYFGITKYGRKFLNADKEKDFINSPSAFNDYTLNGVHDKNLYAYF